MIASGGQCAAIRGYLCRSQSARIRSARASTGSMSHNVLSRSKQIARTAPKLMAPCYPEILDERIAADHGQQELLVLVAARLDPAEASRARVQRTDPAARHSRIRARHRGPHRGEARSGPA